MSILNTVAHTVRVLAADAIEQAKSGHPGLPLGCAEIGTAIFAEVLRHDPSDPRWPNRDRFVLSAGHGSMLLYALLHLSGYDLPMEELGRKSTRLNSSHVKISYAVFCLKKKNK